MILITPNKHFYLDDHDSILAAKKGGFLNKLLISVTDNFNSVTADNLKSFNEKLAISSKEAEIAKSTISILPENFIDAGVMDNEADQEDVLKIFEIYDDIISIIANKEVNAKPAKLSFNV